MSGQRGKERSVYDYVIVGAGRAGASAVEGIRELDQSGSILLVGAEPYLPYDRPPLTKQLWSGKQAEADIYVHDAAYYESEGVTLLTSERVTELRAGERTIVSDSGRSESYRKLLLATGGRPRRLPIPGAGLEGVVYYRTLDHYEALSRNPKRKSILVVGGGFIGSEIAAALNQSGAKVTMVYPGRYLCEQVFPESLARSIQSRYEERGIRTLGRELLTSIAPGARGGLIAHTQDGERLECDAIVVGAGIEPETGLAATAGLRVGNGIEVDELLESNTGGIYAAGDNASFPYRALRRQMRMEHWDNAVSQGRAAGRNMAGAGEPFDYMPYFFSDLFEFGYEAVGDVDTSLTTFADWEEENETGAVYYLRDGRVRGVMLCNVWGRLDEARTLITSGVRVSERDLRGAVRA
jgi:3-phenylpropionate/trans-cinnamate dioxygenase ferredoxin reductase subunit